MLLSAAKVARRWESWGDAASLRSGGAGDSVWLVDFEGEEALGEVAVLTLAQFFHAIDITTYICLISQRARR